MIYKLEKQKDKLEKAQKLWNTNSNTSDFIGKYLQQIK